MSHSNHAHSRQPASEDFRPGSSALSPPASLASSETRQKTKVLCTSGGRFSISLSSTPAQAGISYRGGQTRLLSIPIDATYLELLMLMGRQSGSGSAPGSSHTLPPIIRYQLPSQPDVVVDILDSDDVALMLEEHKEEQQQQAGPGFAKKGARPHLYVEWPQQAVGAAESSAASGRHSASPTARPSRPSMDSRGGRSTADSFSSEDGAHHASLAPAGSPPLRAAKLQMIPAADVQLLSIQGTGTFGDTYRGIWHGSTDVAVKCWNRGVMGMQWNTPASTWAEFAQASDQLAALRHPNLVQVFGVILPEFEEPGQRESEEGAAPPAALPAPAAPLAAAPAPAAVGEPEHAGALVGAQQQELEQEEQQQQEGSQPQQQKQQQCPIGEAGEITSVSTLPQQHLPGDAAAAAPAAAQQLQHGASSGSLGGKFRLPMHTPALVMEFIPGASLRSMMERNGDRELSPTASFICARDVAKAMEYLHSKGVVHMALKSGNVLMSWTGPKPQAKVTAWGMLPFKLAACFSPGLSLRRGWWPWLAPEIFRDPARISEKLDVYSYGILLWELWAQRTPYQGEGWDFVDLVASSFEPFHVRPALPGSQGVPFRPEPAPGWRALMERCWAEDPEQRPSFKEVLRTLHDLGRQLKERSRHSKRQLAGVSEEPAGGQ